MLPSSISAGLHQLAYYESSGTGRPIVFLHGNSLSGRVFQPQFEHALAQRHRVVALDLPGHGASDNAQVPETTYSLPGYADVLVEAVAALGLEHGVFVGWSLGGHILLETAARLPQAAGLLIYGTPPVALPLDMAPLFHPNPALALLGMDDPAPGAIETFVAGCFASDPTPHAAVYQELVAQADPAARPGFMASMQAHHYTDERDIVAQLRTPLAILHGADDAYVRASAFEDLNAPTLWRGQVHAVPGAGHALHADAPDAFAQYLMAFVADLSEAGAEHMDAQRLGGGHLP